MFGVELVPVGLRLKAWCLRASLLRHPLTLDRERACGVRLVRAGAERNEVVEDREAGVSRPEADGSLPARSAAGIWDARYAEPALTESAKPLASASPAKTRKRRKRKRGRKVFAPGGAMVVRESLLPPAGAAPAGANNRPADRPIAGPAPSRPAASTDLAQPRIAAAKAAGPGTPHRADTASLLPVFAALDLGTNNCRLLVAIPSRGGQFRVIDAFSRIVRLGEGLTATGRLGEPAMDRAVDALKVCGDKLRHRNLRGARLIATEACRTAVNGATFLARVKAETGLELEIIDRETEARLAVSGCSSLVEPGTDGIVLFDIGGGSSEIALVDLTGKRSPQLADHIAAWTSLPVGVVSLAERFGGRDVTPEIFSAMVDDVGAMIDGFAGRHRLAHLAKGPRFHLLGTSGTVTTLAGVHLGLDRYDRRRVDGLWMDNDNVEQMMRKLISWSFDERVASPCIGPDRADLVLAGCAILEAIRRAWPAPRLRVADRGLREGILSELMAADLAGRRHGPGARS